MALPDNWQEIPNRENQSILAATLRALVPARHRQINAAVAVQNYIVELEGRLRKAKELLRNSPVKDRGLAEWLAADDDIS